MPKISGLPPMNSPADDDVLAIDDDSVADPTSPDKTKKISLSTLYTYLLAKFQAAVAWVTPSMWSNPYYCKVTRATSQAISNGGGYVTWTAEELDPQNMWGAGSPTRVTVPVKGVYVLISTVTFVGNATGRRAVAFHKNGSSVAPSFHSLFPSVLTGTIAPQGVLMLECEANDYLEVFAYQDSGGNLNLENAARHSFSVALITRT